MTQDVYMARKSVGVNAAAAMSAFGPDAMLLGGRSNAHLYPDAQGRR
jgi:hypothetical protein